MVTDGRDSYYFGFSTVSTVLQGDFMEKYGKNKLSKWYAGIIVLTFALGIG